MKIKQKKEYKPVTITLESEEEYIAFFQIIEEAQNKNTKVFMDTLSKNMARKLSDFATHNV